MPKSNFSQDDWLETLSLAATIIDTIPKPKRPRQLITYPAQCLTKSQRQRHTSIIKAKDAIAQLQAQLTAKIEAKRKHLTNEVNTATPYLMIEEIKALRQRLAFRQSRLRLMEENKPRSLKYRNADFFMGQSEKAWFFRRIIKFGHIQWSRFCDTDGVLTKRGKRGKRRPESEINYFARLTYLRKVGFDENYFLVGKDGRWLIHHMASISKRLKREATTNDYLPAQAEAWQVLGHKLEDWQREQFIKWSDELREYFIDLFVVKDDNSVIT